MANPAPLNPSAIDLLVLAVYLAAVIGIGWRAAKKRKEGSEDYILAGRALTLPTFIASLVTSFYGGVLGVGEYTYRFGLSNWLIQGVPYYIFALLYSLFLCGRIRANPGMTIADHLDRVYGKQTAMFAAFLVFILANPADDILMLGTLASWITGARLWLCILFMTGASICFLFKGGLRSEAWASRLQLVVMFGGFSIILPFTYRAVGGYHALQSRLPPGHLTWTGGNSGLYILSWFFIALWTFVDPSFHQRVCAAKDVRTARLGIIASVVLWCIFDFMTTSAGLYARALIPNISSPIASFPALANALLPSFLRGIFLAGISSSIIASLSAKSFLSAISLARDGIGRASDSSVDEHWVQWGLVATTALSAALAICLPSVIGLWFLLGSTTIPGLLVVLISAYFEPLRIPPRAALACSVGGWIASVGAWIFGSAFPFYPGLEASIGIWLIARIGRECVPSLSSN